LTIGVLRKYLSFLELPISWLLPSDLCCVIGSKGYIQAKVSLSSAYTIRLEIDMLWQFH
jgi:hypothetical protein